MTKGPGKGDEFDDLFTPDAPPNIPSERPIEFSGVEASTASVLDYWALGKKPEESKPQPERTIVRELTDAIARAFQIPQHLLRPLEPDLNTSEGLDKLIRDQMRLQFPEMEESELEKGITLAKEMHRAVQFSMRYGTPMGGARITPTWVKRGGEWQLVGAAIVGGHGQLYYANNIGGPVLQMPSPWPDAKPAGPYDSVNVPPWRTFNPPDDPDEPEDDEGEDDWDEDWDGDSDEDD